MEFFTDHASRIQTIRDLVGEVTNPNDLPSAVGGLDSASVITLLELASDLGRFVERLQTAAAGVISQRSTREKAHAGLAQSRGHRNAVALVQKTAGTSRTEAMRQIRVGESLYRDGNDSGLSDHHVDVDSGNLASDGLVPSDAWRASLRRSLLSGEITGAQHDAITRGLGEPRYHDDDAEKARQVEAWSLAVNELIAEAATATVEDLARSARHLRDLVDPVGAEERYLARFEARSFRMWTDREGLTRAAMTFDDMSAAWMRSMIDAAMRPRRGGPRFVNPAEESRAEALLADPRTNDQIVFDLIIDVVRAGTLSEAETVFGARQPGVRLVNILPVDANTTAAATMSETTDVNARQDTRGGVAYTEDGIVAVPDWVAKQQTCVSGSVVIDTDRFGNPLQLGRTTRLFTPKQRIALAVRDGGCRWTGCDRPASYCEAHHIDTWANGGKTDIDRGIMLCRFHHMQLHYGGWRITREGVKDFVLHDPGGGESSLPRRLIFRRLWAEDDPPPKRFLLVA
ncbi:HNH endonuclease [Leucobacter viscericola]|uniref:HNH endonuclease n=1 Tax=Leucobacter viscericola TaxID=2714935 RepID=A0A6G7XBQ9_9MICO|nr:HNH endonuclease signature motif containing protein [Leucobacter viscericola]QIK62040.1 HNH endonuclease [Leucobacter viscericola]